MRTNYNNAEKSDATNTANPDTGDVAEKGSREVILEFFASHDYPHQPLDVYGGLIYTGDITFSYRTVQNAISELSESGDLSKVAIDREDGVVRELPQNTSKRAHYVITDEGRERINE
jgi:hypothetical protein